MLSQLKCQESDSKKCPKPDSKKCQNSDPKKQVDDIVKDLLSDLSFIEPLTKKSFAKLDDGRIAIKKGDEIFEDDDEDDVWNSYL